LVGVDGLEVQHRCITAGIRSGCRIFLRYRWGRSIGRQILFLAPLSAAARIDQHRPSAQANPEPQSGKSAERRKDRHDTKETITVDEG
jgi:hypothetical protein